MERVRLKYTDDYTNVTTYWTGLQMYENIEYLYQDRVLRNKVVCRIDLTYVLKEILSDDNIGVCGDALMSLAYGIQPDPNNASTVLMALAEDDPPFAEYLNSIFAVCPANRTFGGYIMQCLADRILDEVDMYRTFFRGRDEMVICQSGKYMYFSVPDIGYTLTLPIYTDVEVISYAKVWSGNFQVGGVLHSAIPIRQ